MPRLEERSFFDDFRLPKVLLHDCFKAEEFSREAQKKKNKQRVYLNPTMILHSSSKIHCS